MGISSIELGSKGQWYVIDWFPFLRRNYDDRAGELKHQIPHHRAISIIIIKTCNSRRVRSYLPIDRIYDPLEPDSFVEYSEPLGWVNLTQRMASELSNQESRWVIVGADDLFDNLNISPERIVQLIWVGSGEHPIDGSPGRIRNIVRSEDWNKGKYHPIDIIDLHCGEDVRLGGGCDSADLDCHLLGIKRQ